MGKKSTENKFLLVTRGPNSSDQTTDQETPRCIASVLLQQLLGLFKQNFNFCPLTCFLLEDRVTSASAATLRGQGWHPGSEAKDAVSGHQAASYGSLLGWRPQSKHIVQVAVKSRAQL